MLSGYVCVLQSVKKIVEASEEELALCPGLGLQKVCQHEMSMLTLSSPVMSNGYTSGYSGPYWFNSPFFIF